MIELSEQRRLALRVAWAYHGHWYTWGGDDPAGFDCSGLVVEIGKSVGWFPRKGDSTAEGLRLNYREILPALVQPGDLVFRMQNGLAVHVGIVIDPTSHYIAAEGGGRSVKTLGDAIRLNAFIKVRPISSMGRALERRYATPFREE